ncbi:hypothetical protein ES703_109305 [subsurface metagenome]
MATAIMLPIAPTAEASTGVVNPPIIDPVTIRMMIPGRIKPLRLFTFSPQAGRSAVGIEGAICG